MTTLYDIRAELVTFTPYHYELLSKWSKSLTRMYCNQCNGYEYKGMSTRIKTLQQKCEELIESYSYGLEHQTDPRGSALTVSFKSNEVRI